MSTNQMMQQIVAKRQFKKRTLIKNYQLLAVLITALFFSSCQKTMQNSTVANSISSEAKATAAPGRSRYTKYGALIGSPDSTDGYRFQIHVAHDLSVSCLREVVIVPARNLDTVLVPELTTKYKVLLNFTSPGKGKKLIPFRTDLPQYQQDLNDILNTFTVLPVVGAIENEESNRFFYMGSAQQYVNQLAAGIEVLHARGIKATNGGITNQGLNYLVYQDFLNQGKDDSALQFQLSVHVYPDSPSTQQRGGFIDTLLTNYKTMNLDFVNFHWKGTNPDSTLALNQVINYLKKRTNKQIICNELGQLDTDPNNVVAQVQVCTDQAFPYIIWYSPDFGQAKRGTPLQYSNGKLTPSGYAYQGYLRE